MKSSIKKLYSYRQEFLIIGLTGRTGAGCTTAAQFLSRSLESDLWPSLRSVKLDNYNEERKFEIVLNYAKSKWISFNLIRVKDVITYYLLKEGDSKLLDLIYTRYGIDKSKILKIWPEFDNDLNKILLTVKQVESDSSALFTVFLKSLPEFTDKFKKVLSDLNNAYTSLYQELGNNIRCSGRALPLDENKSYDYSDALIKMVHKVIKSLRIHNETNDKPTYVVVDAFRNPFEVFYFKERFSAFYLISVNSIEKDRLDRLYKLKYDIEDIRNLDEKEYPKKSNGDDMFVMQNIQRCIELADIHISNSQCEDEKYLDIKRQLVYYFTLMIKPGIVTPTSIERVMQLAYSAKLNSGCISRQVGAAISDSSYSIKAIGWNSVPANQTPCLLRNCNHLIKMEDQNAYSQYEKNDKKFKSVFYGAFDCDVIKEFENEGNNPCYCFKEVQNHVDLEKNQVHTRSLHAEENAFLQISKYGGEGIEGGILFTTASPCELCSKKAYQLGIKEIVYIDPYPGIAISHILNCGSHIPTMTLFRGAVGRAYFNLYHGIMSYKDEIKLATDYKYQIQIESVKKLRDIIKAQELEISRLKEKIA